MKPTILIIGNGLYARYLHGLIESKGYSVARVPARGAVVITKADIYILACKPDLAKEIFEKKLRGRLVIDVTPAHRFTDGWDKVNLFTTETSSPYLSQMGCMATVGSILLNHIRESDYFQHMIFHATIGRSVTGDMERSESRQFGMSPQSSEIGVPIFPYLDASLEHGISIKVAVPEHTVSAVGLMEYRNKDELVYSIEKVPSLYGPVIVRCSADNFDILNDSLLFSIKQLTRRI